MKKMKTIEEIWQNLMNGKIVYWGNEGYRLTMEESNGGEYQENHFTNKNGFVLRATCTSNWFGSLIEDSCVEKCFTTEEY